MRFSRHTHLRTLAMFAMFFQFLGLALIVNDHDFLGQCLFAGGFLISTLSVTLSSSKKQMVAKILLGISPIPLAMLLMSFPMLALESYVTNFKSPLLMSHFSVIIMSMSVLLACILALTAPLLAGAVAVNVARARKNRRG